MRQSLYGDLANLVATVCDVSVLVCHKRLVSAERGRLDSAPLRNNEPEVVQMTDEQAASLRHARFGELPPRVLPEDLVEETETDHQPPDVPVPDPPPGSFTAGSGV